MKLKLYLLTFSFLIVAAFSANAQLSCSYRLEMYDSYGDGWNGASIDVNLDDVIVNYTINNGFSNVVEFDVTDGQPFTLNYTAGSYEGEVTYFLYDSENVLVFSDGPNPGTGLVFEGTGSCPTCIAVDAETVSYEGTPNSVVVSWEASQTPGNYVVEYGAYGFEPGSGTSETMSATTFTIPDAEEGEIFDFYVYVDCGDGDVSVTAGPVFVQAGYATAPLACNYTLNLVAENGFGWGPASINVTVNGVTNNYTVEEDVLNVDVPVSGNTLVVLDYVGDDFDDDNSFNLINPEGIVVYASGNNPDSGVLYSGEVTCPTCPAIDVESVEVTQTPGGFDLVWTEGELPGGYIVEYGPIGFEQGSGTMANANTNAFSLSGQDEGELFDVYIALDCGDGDLSFAVGPVLAQAGFLNPPTECPYTLEMFDSFGDGWNGSLIEVTINGTTNTYTVDANDNNGFFNIVPFLVTDGSLVTLNYTAGAFQNEVTYNLLDADGVVIFSDGPNPATGEVFEVVANCPPCPLPLPSSFAAAPIASDMATISWSEVTSAGSYTIEYGAGCIEVGQGTTMTTNTNSVELTGLEQSTLYSYFVTADCGDEGMSNTAGPFFFSTIPACYPPTDVNTLAVDTESAEIGFTINVNTSDYVIEYGPVGFALGGGFTTDPFTGNSGMITGLTPNTTYQYFVYGDCGDDLSEAVGPLFFTTPLPCASVEEIAVDNVTDNTANVTWVGVAGAESYNIEYGPIGFEPGTGITVMSTTTDVALSGLNAGVSYDVYVTSNCGTDGLANVSNAFNFGTTGGNTCTWTLEMYDSFGDGWNGSIMNVQNGTLNEDYTITTENNGEFNIVEITVTGGLPLIFTYTAGAFQNEVTFAIYDADGNLVLEDGPNPATGEIYNEVAVCGGGGCAVPFAEVVDVRAVTADIAWLPSEEASAYTIEWGEVGFTLGSGTTASTTETEYTIEGLTPGTWYNVYITPDCAEGLNEFSFGALQFQTYVLTDVGISGFDSPVVGSCVFGSEDVSVFIQNFGQNPQQLIPFFYTLNFEGQNINNPVDGFYTGVVGKDSMEVIQFDNPFDFSELGYYYFEAWTELEGDENPNNDTLRYEFISAYPLPLQENFNQITQETGLPDGWTSPNGVPVLQPGDNPHGLLNGAASAQINFGNPSLEFTTARYGPIESTSDLYFEYRFVTADFQGVVSPYSLDENDTLRVQISADCGENYETIYELTEGEDLGATFFKPVTLDLSAYEGEGINIRFLVNSGDFGNFFADIDNINIAGCPDDLFIQINQSAPATFGESNGTLFAQPTFGIAPFTFEWSNGQTTAVASDLAFTDYSVTVTDANGCSSERTFSPELTNTEEESILFDEISLNPNPTTGNTQLTVELPVATAVNVEIYDLAGRLVKVYKQENQTTAVFDLDMNDEPNGMYLVRVEAADRTQVLKLAVAK